MSKMFEDRDMMEHPICPVSELDCKLINSLLFVDIKSYYHHKFISGLAIPGIFIVFTGVVFFLKRKEKNQTKMNTSCICCTYY